MFVAQQKRETLDGAEAGGRGRRNSFRSASSGSGLGSERSGPLLLLQGVNVGGTTWWVSPGGGLREGETFEEAAARELFEETGIRSPIGPCVWTRHHRFEWYGKPHNQFERFFVACIGSEIRPAPPDPDGYIVGHRWWTLHEIQTSSDQFSPRRLGTLLPPIVRGEYPSLPLDAGV